MEFSQYFRSTSNPVLMSIHFQHNIMISYLTMISYSSYLTRRVELIYISRKHMHLCSAKIWSIVMLAVNRHGPFCFNIKGMFLSLEGRW